MFRFPYMGEIAVIFNILDIAAVLPFNTGGSTIIMKAGNEIRCDWPYAECLMMIVKAIDRGLPE